jgi:hypothetical protein
MHRLIRSLPLLLGLATLGGCEDGVPWSADGPQVEDETRAGFGPSAAYDRRLVFLGPADGPPAAAVLDFTALSDSAGVRRGARVRWLDEGTWSTAMDAGWAMDPLRDPWRVLPHGRMTVVVNDAGEIGAIGFRDDPALRLETGRVLAETSPDAGTQFVLRQARLLVGDREAAAGVLIDAQLGRSVPGGAPTVPRAATAPPAGDSLPAPDSADPAAGPAADSAAAPEPPADSLPPTPVALPGTEAFLVSDSGYYAVLARSTAGEIAWIGYGGREDIRRGVALEPTAWADFPEADLQVPAAWRISAPDVPINGELMAEATDRVVLTGPADASALTYVLVSGWVEDRGARHDVYGVLRHVR